jgi:hypothetical protein
MALSQSALSELLEGQDVRSAPLVRFSSTHLRSQE